MTEAIDSSVLAWLVEGLGVAGALTFFGRFYVQWIVSELKGRSVMPVAFWYMSSVGALLLFGYGVLIQSPVAVLSYCFNLVVYARNLIHIWREKGTLSRGRAQWVHLGVGAVVLAAAALAAWTWLREVAEAPPAEHPETWLWIAVGTAGTGLFALRFLLQWVATELRRKSVVPVAFWYISIVAALLLASAYIQREEWIYAVGVVSTLVVYARNLYLIYRKHPERVSD